MTMRKAFRHAVALSLLSWLVAPRVHAQYDPGATVGLGQGMIANNGVIAIWRSARRGSSRDARGDAIARAPRRRARRRRR
ncbi:hypothetical protein NW95_19850 [Burkholderia mallei]|nr:hypothetical protein NW95_19850 [Burkholderia mallei]